MKGREGKPHIGIFGRRNAGKSSLINVLTGQNTAIVSEEPGTTTDPVKKSMEIPGVGACVIIDTAGIDEESHLGKKRVEKTRLILKQIDLALLVFTHNDFGSFEDGLMQDFIYEGIPFVLVHNKNDLEKISNQTTTKLIEEKKCQLIDFSTINPAKINDLTELIKKNIPEKAYKKATLMGNMLSYGDVVLLITPIDAEAPEGRLILPQVQAIRDVLDNDCIAVVCKEREVDVFLKTTRVKPALAVADSSVLHKIQATVPQNIPLTGFSILLARLKGDFEAYLNGTPAIEHLKDGDRILLLESCTHHVSCDDIGRVKIPRWIQNYTGKTLQFDVVAGLDNMQRPIDEYALVIQCGGCMITQRQVQARLKGAKEALIPITNYGMAIAYVQGVYYRSINPFVKDAEGLKSMYL